MGAKGNIVIASEISLLNKKQAAETGKKKGRERLYSQIKLRCNALSLMGGHAKQLWMKSPHHFIQDMTPDPHK